MSKVQCLPHWQVVAGQPDDIIITSDIEKTLRGIRCTCVSGFVSHLLFTQEEFMGKQTNSKM